MCCVCVCHAIHILSNRIFLVLHFCAHIRNFMSWTSFPCIIVYSKQFTVQLLHIIWSCAAALKLEQRNTRVYLYRSNDGCPLCEHHSAKRLNTKHVIIIIIIIQSDPISMFSRKAYGVSCHLLPSTYRFQKKKYLNYSFSNILFEMKMSRNSTVDHEMCREIERESEKHRHKFENHLCDTDANRERQRSNKQVH